MNYAIVGFGGLGKAHFRNTEELSQKVEDIKLVAICDVDETTFTTQRNINISADETKMDLSAYKLYTDPAELFEKEKLDFIITALPTYLHEKIAVMAMEKGIHVFSEKPMAINAMQAQNMLDKAKEYNVKLMIGQCVRYFPEYVYLKKLIDSKKYGEVKYANFTRISGIPKWSWQNWFHDEEKSGGVLLDMHVHDVDFINYVFGKPSSVYTRAASHRMVDDTAVTLYGYEDKLVTASSTWGMETGYPFTAEFLINFENATLELKNNVLKLYDGGDAVDVDVSCEALEIESSSGYVNEVIDFIQCIRNNGSSKVNPPESSKLTLDIALAEKVSAKTGKLIEL